MKENKIKPIRREEIPLQEIKEPHDKWKLHPRMKTNENEWKDFVESVGTSPRDPLDVIERKDGYELIDGNRRYRALRDNRAKTVECRVYSEDDIENEKVLGAMMIEANDQRDSSDQIQLGRWTARYVKPWLLDPEDRFDDWSSSKPMSQHEFAELINKPNSQGSISRWVSMWEEKVPLRAAIGSIKTGRGKPVPGPDDIRKMEMVYRVFVQDDDEFDTENNEWGQAVTQNMRDRRTVSQAIQKCQDDDRFTIERLYKFGCTAVEDDLTATDIAEEMKDLYYQEPKKEEPGKNLQEVKFEEHVNDAHGKLKDDDTVVRLVDKYNKKVLKTAIDKL